MKPSLIQVAKAIEGETTKVGSRKWNLKENATSTPWEELIENYNEKISMDCSGCEQNGPWCNCTLQKLRQEHNYSLSIKIEETLPSQGVEGATVSQVTTCPITNKNTDFFNCYGPDNDTVQIPASLLCNGVPNCPNQSDEEYCHTDEFLLTFPIVGIFLASSVLALAWGRCQSKKQGPKTKPVEVSPAVLTALKNLHQKVKTTKGAQNEAETTTAEATDEVE